jgi:putative DNA primase/helicase
MTPEEARELAPKLEVLAAQPSTQHPRSDLGNARRLVEAHGDDLIHVAGEWFHFVAGRWLADDTGEATRRQVRVVDALLAEAITAPEEERKTAVPFALRAQGARSIAAALELAAASERIARSVAQLDADPMILSTRNGVIDLRTGEMRLARRDDLITRGSSVAYDPDADCPRFKRFVGELFAGDLELIDFVQRLIGYWLTGRTDEHVLAVFHGAGGNGKSTLINVLEDLLGDHALTTGFDTFMARGGGSTAEYDLARFRSARLVVASESAQGRRLDDRVVKQVTGGDTITARHPYGRPFSYRPAFKVVLVTNHRPQVDGDDDGIWRRLRLVPFEQSFVGREDRTLGPALRRELPGILAWAVQGCLRWQQHGLGQPQAVTNATSAYRLEEDTIGTFLADCCTLDAGGRVTVADLRGAYERWSEQHGERPLSAKALTQSLLRRGGITTGRTKHSRYYAGLALGGCRVTAGDRRNGKSPHARAQGEVSETANAPDTRHPEHDDGGTR